MNAQECILTRRSTRKFAAKPVESELIDRVVEAGRYAPSGGNNQYTHFFVITDKAVLDELADLAQVEFAKMEVTEGMYKSMANSVRASKKGNYRFHYDAPVLIVTANRISYGNHMADCACALENMMLMANALDLGSVWINQLNWLGDHESIRKVFARYGLTEDERIYGALSVGWPDTEDGLPNRKTLPRTGNPVTYI